MASARRHDTSELRGQIREAALRLFAQHGFLGTSIQQVADAVGISKQLLLYHYPSKDALRQSVVDVITSAWTEFLPRLLDAISSSQERTDLVSDELYAFLEEHADMARVVMLELVNDTGPLGARIAGDVRPWMQVAADFIRLRQREGTFGPEVDPEAFVVGIGTLLLGTIALLHMNSAAWPAGAAPEEWRRRRLREAVRMLKASLLVPAVPTLG
ncbi:MAG: TetR/AcrR family transcriptional regulator [Pseudomonadota bacterium]|nr:TetR/AcrR family transcriptional regulator [Pseudomonadota bacterium]